MPIVSPDNKNHQMFAFCPMNPTKACGSSSLVSNATVQNVTAKGTIGMKIGLPKERKYDACYYEISSVNKEALGFTDEKNGLRVYVRVNKMENMNVYVYGGSNR